MHIRTNDYVQVMAGDNRGDRGKVIRVLRKVGKIIVEGVNKTKKHVKPSQVNPRGGQLEKELPIDVSNVMLICPQTNKPTRIGFRKLADGSKERYAKKSGASLGIVAPPLSKKRAAAPAGGKSK
jgi:large subunit ribosomal protein L24